MSTIGITERRPRIMAVCLPYSDRPFAMPATFDGWYGTRHSLDAIDHELAWLSCTVAARLPC
jgi:hypothetical protein